MTTVGQAGEADIDHRFMAAAIRLSRRHLGLTAENPSVGALIVRQADDGSRVIVGRGVTARGGRPHAELQALAEAGERARGATVYCTLEPCSHIGRAPPCADALVAAGVERVVIATLDPDPRVAGRGVAILERAGISVSVGIEGTAARAAMEGFLSLKARGRPFVTLKLAVSADGMIGRKGAGQVAITGPLARREVHVMRSMHEAILVGVGTVLEDDPLLSVRLDGMADRSPARVVVDPFCRTPPTASLLAARDCGRVVVLASEKARPMAADALRDSGATVSMLPSDYRGRFRPDEILRSLGVLGLKSVLVEGGADTARRFIEADIVDRISLFRGRDDLGTDGLASPITETALPAGFVRVGAAAYGSDRLVEFERKH
jgi:diaminohydroxyphosphoribosylaminopyrimidine deaminase/5-amino-6-(5-phosphoribosylamino)uracil reductase